MNECAQAKEMLVSKLGINLTVVDASDLSLDRLAGVVDPERKRKIIGNTFIEVFEREAERIELELDGKGGKIEFLLQVCNFRF
jgi:GMP synthase (glutamine-hydrolysing)